RSGLRRWAADLTFERLISAERNRRRDLVDELASRLSAFGGGYQAQLAADAHLELSLSPEATTVFIERPGSQPERVKASPAVTLAPGSLVLVLEAPGRVTVRMPILLGRGESRRGRVALPAYAPPGLIYVPP